MRVLTTHRCCSIAGATAELNDGQNCDTGGKVSDKGGGGGCTSDRDCVGDTMGLYRTWGWEERGRAVSEERMGRGEELYRKRRWEEWKGCMEEGLTIQRKIVPIMENRSEFLKQDAFGYRCVCVNVCVMHKTCRGTMGTCTS